MQITFYNTDDGSERIIECDRISIQDKDILIYNDGKSKTIGCFSPRDDDLIYLYTEFGYHVCFNFMDII
jgi:hypothetical protein